MPGAVQGAGATEITKTRASPQIAHDLVEEEIRDYN